MTIRKLKELIKDLPDDVRIYADDGIGFYEGNSEFVEMGYNVERNMCVFQVKDDIDVPDALEQWLEYASENNINEQDFWIEFYEKGYEWSDFDEDNEELQIWAKEQLENYGLI